jgi:DNA-directed RNA polymerase specialized sigma24 family protein
MNPMTRDEYGRAYEHGFDQTTRLLCAKGVPFDTAHDAAQSAWVKGWEFIGQLRDPGSVITWVNSIALNVYRNSLRRKNQSLGIRDIPVAPQINVAAIDLARVIEVCRPKDRGLLTEHFIYGFDSAEIARRSGCTATAVRLRLMRARRAVVDRITKRRPPAAIAAA